MKILVIGGGGREHALVWKIKEDDPKSIISVCPGNAGMAAIPNCYLYYYKLNDIVGLAKFAEKTNIDLTIVGPELPLSLGIVDEFHKRGLAIFGPIKEAAKIEWSKSFAKDLMVCQGIPTAGYRTFFGYEKDKAISSLRNGPFPTVIKADGLMAGKGVKVCREGEVAEFINRITQFEAGKKFLVEDYLEGKEISFIAFTDGETVLPLLVSKDYKQFYPGGPNTGGVAALAPIKISSELHKKIMEKIMIPAVKGLREKGSLYKGILYAGLIIIDGEPFVLEFNCRFGDPEIQVLLMLLKNKLIEVIQKTLDGKLNEVKLDWYFGAAACIILCSKGYPDKPEIGKRINGLKALDKYDDLVAFHAGTNNKNGRIITSGGRVIGITARSHNLKNSIKRAYTALKAVDFEGVHYICYNFLEDALK